MERGLSSGASLTNLWVRYSATVDKPLAYSTLSRRRLLWIAAGKPDLWSAPTETARAPAAPVAPIAIASGLAYLDADGVALQVRRGALCIRFRDSAERLFQPGEHSLKTIILVGSGGSLTVEAVRWCEAARVGVLIAGRHNEAFSLFATSPVLSAKIKDGATALRRKQFTADAFKIARLIVGLKIKSYALERADERAALARLAKARAVTDIISIEGAATRLYWDRWRGTPLAFRDNAPAAWKTFQTRVAPTPRNRHRSERTTAIFSARHARHPIGAQLNYAYKVALAQITRAIIGHDLDPVYGFLHGDRRGRLSFSYDVLELFRARIDAVIFKFVRLRKFERADFAEFEGGVVRLSNRLARDVAALLLRSIPFAEIELAVRMIAKAF